MSFGGRVTATKIELIKIRRSMQVAKMVHKILDDKRELLLKKIDEMIEEANKAREDIWTPLDEIYTSVYNAYMSLGTMTLESISDSTPSIMEVDVKIMLPGICKAAEYENAIFSLAKELERTQKLLNALEYVIIPQYQDAIYFIKATLEEREREEFVRLKKVKVVLEKKKNYGTEVSTR